MILESNQDLSKYIQSVKRCYSLRHQIFNQYQNVDICSNFFLNLLTKFWIEVATSFFFSLDDPSHLVIIDCPKKRVIVV